MPNLPNYLIISAQKRRFPWCESVTGKGLVRVSIAIQSGLVFGIGL